MALTRACVQSVQRALGGIEERKVERAETPPARRLVTVGGLVGLGVGGRGTDGCPGSRSCWWRIRRRLGGCERRVSGASVRAREWDELGEAIRRVARRLEAEDALQLRVVAHDKVKRRLSRFPLVSCQLRGPEERDKQR